VTAPDRGPANQLQHSSRDVILERIRSAIADAPTPEPIPREYRTTGDAAPGSDAAIELLVDRLEDYKASVRIVAESELADAVNAALEPVHSLVIGPGLEQRIADACRGHDRVVTVDGEPNTLSSAELDGIDAVVTQAKVAIAVTGTIILDAGPGQGRRAISLVPDRHLVVVWANQIVDSVPEGIARLTPTAPLTMISGPSATSDIELSRVEGVHGPRILDVLIVRR
jgi:L-lactate dehydrogenase complex protein LldG